jgi:hypothetical protein
MGKVPLSFIKIHISKLREAGGGLDITASMVFTIYFLIEAPMLIHLVIP